MIHKHTYSIPSADDQNDVRCIECGQLQPTTHTATHTPGPWAVHTFTISGKEKLEVLDATGTNACVQANAHLIAAAPAMYEALQAMLDGILYTRGAPMTEDRWRTLTTIARQAIAQAEGRQA